MVRLLLVLFLGCLILAGCGGGGGDSKSELTRSVQITWPQRTRETLDAPTSALSAKITILRGNSFGDDVVFTANREAGETASHIGTYVIPQAITSSSFALRVEFFGGADGSGDLVAVAQATFDSSKPILKIANVVLDRKVKALTVTPATLEGDAAPTQLEFSAKDAEGNLVAVSPGSAQWSLAVPSTNIELSPDGMATPRAPGTATVVATVDGVRSGTASVTVRSFFRSAFRFSGPNDTIHLTGGQLKGACSLLPAFTVEAVVRVEAPGTLWQQWQDGAMNQMVNFRDGNWTTLTTGSGQSEQRMSGFIPPSQWVHIAWCWDGYQSRVYRDGNLTATSTFSPGNVPIFDGQACAIGKNATVPYANDQNAFKGDLAVFRISSMARYSGVAFQPPTRPWTVDASTLALVDASSFVPGTTSFAVPGTQGLTAELGIPKGTAPTLVPFAL